MSVRSALAKLSAAAAGGALIGGAAHVAEPQAQVTSYKSAKAAPLRDIKQRPVRRTIPQRPPTAQRVIPPPAQQEYAMIPVPMPLPPMPQAPVVAGGGGTPIVIGGSGGFGGSG